MVLVLHILAPSGKHNGSVLQKHRTDHIDPHVNLLLPHVMQEASLFDALLATCQASIAISAGLSAYNDRFFMLHRGRAMAGLRKKLGSSVDAIAMVSITMLITCDYLTGDLKAVADHSKALQKMADLRGELPNETAWDRFMRRGVEAYKSIGYIATGALPAEDYASVRSHLDQDVDPFRPLVYPRPPFSPQDCVQWSRLPSGFSDLILAMRISDQLTTIICAVNEIGVDVGDDLLETVRACQPIQAALQRFSQHTEASYLERCVAAGLLAYTYQYPRLQMPNLFHDPPMQGFVRLFSIPHRLSSTQDREVLMWAQMAVEGFVSTRTSRLPGSREIFQEALWRHELMRDWMKFEPVVQRHFCTPQVVERWKACHASFTETSSFLPSTTVPSSLVTVETLSTVSDAYMQPTDACPFAGRIAHCDEGDAMPCPFRPSAS